MLDFDMLNFAVHITREFSDCSCHAFTCGRERDGLRESVKTSLLRRVGVTTWSPLVRGCGCWGRAAGADTPACVWCCRLLACMGSSDAVGTAAAVEGGAAAGELSAAALLTLATGCTTGTVVGEATGAGAGAGGLAYGDCTGGYSAGCCIWGASGELWGEGEAEAGFKGSRMGGGMRGGVAAAGGVTAGQAAAPVPGSITWLAARLCWRAVSAKASASACARHADFVRARRDRLDEEL